MNDFLKSHYKTGAKSEDALVHYAYTRTLIDALNQSKLYTLFPDIMKENIIKLIATFFSTSELIKLALKEKERRNK
jgi:hypothetical protein